MLAAEILNLGARIQGHKKARTLLRCNRKYELYLKCLKLRSRTNIPGDTHSTRYSRNGDPRGLHTSFSSGEFARLRPKDRSSPLLSSDGGIISPIHRHSEDVSTPAYLLISSQPLLSPALSVSHRSQFLKIRPPASNNRPPPSPLKSPQFKLNEKEKSSLSWPKPD